MREERGSESEAEGEGRGDGGGERLLGFLAPVVLGGWEDEGEEWRCWWWDR